MQLVPLEYSLLICFLVDVDAETVEAVFAVVVSDHLASECSLLFLEVVDDPDSTDINLLAEVLPIFNRNQFFNISDSKIIFEFQGATLI